MAAVTAVVLATLQPQPPARHAGSSVVQRQRSGTDTLPMSNTTTGTSSGRRPASIHALKRPRLAIPSPGQSQTQTAGGHPAGTSQRPQPPAHWCTRLPAALSPYLGLTRSHQLTHELFKFMDTGLSIAAYDSLVFGIRTPRGRVVEEEGSGSRGCGGARTGSHGAHTSTGGGSEDQGGDASDGYGGWQCEENEEEDGFCSDL